MKIKAAVLTQLNAPLQVEEITLPKLQKGQVLVRLAYSGICRSQLNEVKGYKGNDPYLPHTLGHEGSGEVVEIGEGVTKVQPEDKVVLTWLKGTGLDVPSCQYESKGKIINSGAISTFMQFAIISENRLVKIPSTLPLDQAALLGCAFPTGAGIVYNQLKIKENQSLAIFGMGGIGMSSLLAARERNASPIIAIDVSKEKLEKALELGATHAVNLQEECPHTEIMKITNNIGTDFSIESAGKKTAMEMAFKVISNQGKCVLAGNLRNEEKISIDPFDLIKGKTIVGSWGGKTSIETEVPKYSQLILDGKISLKNLISDVVKLEEINEIFEKLENGQIQRALIKF
ncbi:MAG: zinc-binding dehydrogenase [Chlamydiota bacterium]|jgi:S-(hydroxymethyl)glutathione dehydrogenase/alcohol dehydrogenase